MTIRTLTADDAEIYRHQRLAALAEHPLAYVTDYSEEAALPLEEFQKRLAAETSVTFGAFDAERLAGISTLLTTTRLRQRFRATIVGMHVLPEYRRRGIATQLLSACVARARELPEVEEVCLCITVGNDAARAAYVAFGFEPELIEPRYFKYEGRYYDLEWLRLTLR
ncbi:MAG TPA: N-acetyltransferase [Pirellulaceae bacterium]|nr:N-acetyltransferase [Pirellulaceae bacterium]